MKKEADMTLQELSSKKDCFSTFFVGSPEDFSTDLTLATYLEALYHSESLIPDSSTQEADCAKQRSRVLNSAVKRLAKTEIKGKEHVEEYVRSQRRCYCSPSTMHVDAYSGL